MQCPAETHQRIRWPSSLATRLTALISVLKKEWNPPQCAMMKSPCTSSTHVRPNCTCQMSCGAAQQGAYSPGSHLDKQSSQAATASGSGGADMQVTGCVATNMHAFRSSMPGTLTQCVSSSTSRTPRFIWSVRLSTWSFVCSRSAALCV